MQEDEEVMWAGTAIRKKKEEEEQEKEEEKRKKEEKGEEEEEKRKKEEEEEKKQFLLCNQLYKDIINDNWEKAKSAFHKDSSAITGPINSHNNIALHLAVGTVASKQFITNLVGIWNKDKDTALHYAGIVGNTEAARILVDKNPSLTKFRGFENKTPLHCAAQYAHKDTFRFLLPVTRREDPGAFAGEDGALLLNYLIMSEFYDMAIDLLKCYPDLAIQKDIYEGTPLNQLAGQTNSFLSGNQLNFFQRLLYKFICVEKVNVHHREDVENPGAEPEPKQRKFKFLRHVHNTKLKHVRALQFTKTLCAETAKLITLKKDKLFTDPILKAARLGIHELVWEIFTAFPDAIQGLDEDGRDIFGLAVLYRKEKVYNFLYQMRWQKDAAISGRDKFGNNILHLAGLLGPSDRVSGAALQMQRELQWFEVLLFNQVETTVRDSLFS